MSKQTVGPSLLDKMWTELDAATDAVMRITPETDPEAAGRLKGLARGLATAIFITSVPHFHSADAVVSCAVARHGEGTADGRAPSAVHTPPPDGRLMAGTDEDPIDVPKPRRKGSSLTGEQKTGIRSALAGGLDVPTVAIMFGVEQDQVEGLT